jgi:U4/U6.U5 tri-snRNP component SNU23
MNMKVERSTYEQVKARIEYNKRKLEKKTEEYDIQARMIELKEEEEKLKEYRREKRKEKKQRKHQSDEQQIDEEGKEMMKLMNFSSFGKR